MAALEYVRQLIPSTLMIVIFIPIYIIIALPSSVLSTSPETPTTTTIRYSPANQALLDPTTLETRTTPNAEPLQPPTP